MTIADQVQAFGSADFYQNYLRAREAVRAMTEVPAERVPASARPVGDRSEQLSKFAYLFDAPPAIIAKIRHHCHLVSGVAAENYKNEKKEKPLYENKLKALRKLDTSNLFVPESRVLGGFGYELNLGLANLETLKTYECTIAMERGGALAGLRRLPERQVVLDIGGGWGGIVYALKTLFPKTCFVLCDVPEALLLSATYLQTVFPGAKVAFVTSEASRFKGGWAAHDFIFVPHAFYQAIAPERIDLMIDSGSPRPVGEGTIQAYVKLAAAKNCPIVYSLCPKTPSGVSAAVEQSYWVSEIPMLLVPHTKLLDGRAPAESAVAARWRKVKDVRAAPAAHLSEDERADIDYKHIVGWKRLG
jgi:hypothetical protein